MYIFHQGAQLDFFLIPHMTSQLLFGRADCPFLRCVLFFFSGLILIPVLLIGWLELTAAGWRIVNASKIIKAFFKYLLFSEC